MLVLLDDTRCRPMQFCSLSQDFIAIILFTYHILILRRFRRCLEVLDQVEFIFNGLFTVIPVEINRRCFPKKVAYIFNTRTYTYIHDTSHFIPFLFPPAGRIDHAQFSKTCGIIITNLKPVCKSMTCRISFAPHQIKHTRFSKQNAGIKYGIIPPTRKQTFTHLLEFLTSPTRR